MYDDAKNSLLISLTVRIANCLTIEIYDLVEYFCYKNILQTCFAFSIILHAKSSIFLNIYKLAESYLIEF